LLKFHNRGAFAFIVNYFGFYYKVEAANPLKEIVNTYLFLISWDANLIVSQ